MYINQALFKPFVNPKKIFPNKMEEDVEGGVDSGLFDWVDGGIIISPNSIKDEFTVFTVGALLSLR